MPVWLVPVELPEVFPLVPLLPEPLLAELVGVAVALAVPPPDVPLPLLAVGVVVALAVPLPELLLPLVPLSEVLPVTGTLRFRPI